MTLREGLLKYLHRHYSDPDWFVMTSKQCLPEGMARSRGYVYISGFRIELEEFLSADALKIVEKSYDC